MTEEKEIREKLRCLVAHEHHYLLENDETCTAEKWDNVRLTDQILEYLRYRVFNRVITLTK